MTQDNSPLLSQTTDPSDNGREKEPDHSGATSQPSITTVSTTTKTNFVLIDYENIQPQVTALPNGSSLKIRLFVGAKQDKISLDLAQAMHAAGSDAEFIRIEGIADDALDLYIAYYIGLFVGSRGGQCPDSFFHIISKDRGFDPLIKHLRTKNIFCSRSDSWSSIPFDGIEATVTAPEETRTGNGKMARCTSPASEPAAAVPISDKLEAIIANLANRKTGRPKTKKTLCGTIKSMFGGKLPANEIHGLFEQLVELRCISVSKDKVTYHSLKLPKKITFALGTQPPVELETQPIVEQGPQASPALALDPINMLSVVEAYRGYWASKLKCDIPPREVRVRIYEIVRTALDSLGENETIDLKTLADHTHRSLSAMTMSPIVVYKVLYTLFRARAFEAQITGRPSNVRIRKPAADFLSWDYLFMKTLVSLIQRDEPTWPLIADGLSAVFGVGPKIVQSVLADLSAE